MTKEGILATIAIVAPLVFFFYVLWVSDIIGDLKKTNARLNDELQRLTDRDERGRFVRKEGTKPRDR